jgi:hypothetical protein
MESIQDLIFLLFYPPPLRKKGDTGGFNVPFVRSAQSKGVIASEAQQPLTIHHQSKPARLEAPEGQILKRGF